MTSPSPVDLLYTSITQKLLVMQLSSAAKRVVWPTSARLWAWCVLLVIIYWIVSGDGMNPRIQCPPEPSEVNISDDIMTLSQSVLNCKGINCGIIIELVDSVSIGMAHNIIIIIKNCRATSWIFFYFHNDNSVQYPISCDWYDLEVTLEGSDLESCSPMAPIHNSIMHCVTFTFLHALIIPGDNAITNCVRRHINDLCVNALQ